LRAAGRCSKVVTQRPGSIGYRLVDRTDANGRVIRAVSGFDATFSAPKSLSVLWVLTQDPRLLDAHDSAVNARCATSSATDRRHASVPKVADCTRTRSV